jgi:uncharacterized protein YlxW (UPF0749 family)
VWLSWLASGPGNAVTPVGAASGDFISYILSYGVLGVVAVIVAAALYRGWQISSPAQRDKERAEARADLEQHNAQLRDDREKLQARCEQLEGQVSDALKVSRDQLVPLLLNFTAATNSLLPLLQDVVATLEGRRDRSRR